MANKSICKCPFNKKTYSTFVKKINTLCPIGNWLQSNEIHSVNGKHYYAWKHQPSLQPTEIHLSNGKQHNAYKHFSVFISIGTLKLDGPSKPWLPYKNDRYLCRKYSQWLFIQQKCLDFDQNDGSLFTMVQLSEMIISLDWFRWWLSNKPSPEPMLTCFIYIFIYKCIHLCTRPPCVKPSDPRKWWTMSWYCPIVSLWS